MKKQNSTGFLVFCLQIYQTYEEGHSISDPSPRGQINKPVLWMKGVKTRDKMAESLTKMLREGPEVSLSGSPTVSPITAALCSSEPFFLTTPPSTNLPDSMNFLALSQAPPVLELEMAIWTPLTRAPGNKPATALGPKKRPTINGVRMT